jgi:WD40 repeat protein
MTLLKRMLPLALCLMLTVAAVAGPVSPDNKIVAVPDNDTIRLFTADTGKEFRAMKGHAGAVTAVDFSPDGKWLASGGNDKNTILWDVASGKQLWQFQGKANVIKVEFSPDAKSLTITDADNKAITVDSATGKALK